MKWPFLSSHQRKKAHFSFSQQAPSGLKGRFFTMVFTRGIGVRRLIAYGVPFLILIMVYQIWKRPCHSTPFGGQVWFFIHQSTFNIFKQKINLSDGGGLWVTNLTSFLYLLPVARLLCPLARSFSLKQSFTQNKLWTHQKRGSLCYSISLWTPTSRHIVTTEWNPWSSSEECPGQVPLWLEFCWTPIRISAVEKRHVSYPAFCKCAHSGLSLRKKKCGWKKPASPPR